MSSNVGRVESNPGAEAGGDSMTKTRATRATRAIMAVVHYGEVYGCRFLRVKHVRAICNYAIIGNERDKNFTTNIREVTCKGCLE